MYPDDVQRLYRWAGSGCRCRLRQEAAAEGVLTQRGPSQAAGVLDADSPAACVCQLHCPLCASTNLSERCNPTQHSGCQLKLGAAPLQHQCCCWEQDLSELAEPAILGVPICMQAHMLIITEPWKHSNATPYVLASLGQQG